MNIRISKVFFALLSMALLGSPSASTAAGNSPFVKFALKFPTEVPINLQPPLQNEGRTTVSAGLTLTNTSRSDITLTSSNSCMSHTWEVTDDASHKVVENSGMCPMVFLPVHLKIEAGKSFTENRDVVLTGTKYSNNGSYTLRYHYWGYTQTATFTAKVSQ